MRKVLVILLVLGICLVGAIQFAFATGTAGSPRGTAPGRFLDKLPEEIRAQVESIIKEYQDKMAALREEMREKIAPYVPEELKEQFENWEPGAAMFPPRMVLDRFLDKLPEETRAQVESIIKEYQDKMAALHDEMKAYRESGDQENLMKLRDEMLELKQEMREKIASYIPEDLKEQFENWEPGMRHTNRFEGRSFKHGWKGFRGPCGETDSGNVQE